MPYEAYWAHSKEYLATENLKVGTKLFLQKSLFPLGEKYFSRLSESSNEDI